MSNSSSSQINLAVCSDVRCVIASFDCCVSATSQRPAEPSFFLWIDQGSRQPLLRGFETPLEDETVFALVVRSLDKKRNSTALPKIKSAAQCNSSEPGQPTSNAMPGHFRYLQSMANCSPIQETQRLRSLRLRLWLPTSGFPV